MGLKGQKKNIRRFTGGGPRPDLKAVKVKEAEERNAAWAAFSPKEQLAHINRRFPDGTGAPRQRGRLAKLLALEQPVQAKKEKAKK